MDCESVPAARLPNDMILRRIREVSPPLHQSGTWHNCHMVATEGADTFQLSSEDDVANNRRTHHLAILSAAL